MLHGHLQPRPRRWSDRSPGGWIITFGSPKPTRRFDSTCCAGESVDLYRSAPADRAIGRRPDEPGEDEHHGHERDLAGMASQEICGQLENVHLLSNFFQYARAALLLMGFLQAGRVT